MASYKSAEYNFFEWVQRWVKDGYNPDVKKSPDLLELVTIFQILGFTVTHSDALNPADMSCLQWGEKGLKINLSCGHSGVRFTLEGVNDCNCPSKMVETVQQISSMNVQDEVEKRNQMTAFENIRLLTVPQKEQEVIKTLLIHLVHMIHPSPSMSDSNDNIVKDNYENYLKGPKTPVKREPVGDGSGEVFHTPGRNDNISMESEKSSTQTAGGLSKSLDNLPVETKGASLPDLGQLVKQVEDIKKNIIPTVTCSSPNLSTAVNPIVNTSSPVANMILLNQGYSKLLSVQELVKDVLKIFEKSQEVPNFSMDISNIKTSAESLIQKAAPQKFIFDQNIITRTTVTKPLCRPSIRSVTSSTMRSTVSSTATSTTNTNTLSKPVSSTRRKSSDNVSPTFKSASKSQKFAHVKSTIPKGNIKKQ